MKEYLRLTLAAALLITVHEAPAAAQGDSQPQATPVATCDMRLRLELTPDVSNPGDVEFINSLVSSHPDSRMTVACRRPLCQANEQSPCALRPLASRPAATS